MNPHDSIVEGMVETWLEHAEQFLGKHQWGPQGRYIGVSRMLKEEDLDSLRKSKVVISQRPRGILSGFLAILPNNGNAVYIPPVSGKVGPRSIRVRHRLEKGAIFSAYWLKNELVVEDVIVWNDESVWMNKTFEARWAIMRTFIEMYYKPDVVQGVVIKTATYQSLQNLTKPAENMVLEFVMNEPKQKRVIWTNERKIQTEQRLPTIVAKQENEQPPVDTFVVKKDLSAGPDVYTVYRGQEKLGYALVKTLAISKALRNAQQEEIPIDAAWSKQFGKWEIKRVLLP